MPELPEVETVCRALACHLPGKVIAEIDVRQPQLRQKIDSQKMSKACLKKTIVSLRRRAKYIILELNSNDALLLHLGMTGKFRITQKADPFRKHEHLAINFTDESSLRYEDHRRFGSIIPVKLPKSGGMPAELADLGPEPLTDDFHGDFLFKISRGKKKPIKNFIMDNANVVGVGNIYASEALFRAKILPAKLTGKLTKKEALLLCGEIKNILQLAINAGGTTISDFISPTGQEGYFFRELSVYGRENEPCYTCQSPIQRVVQAGRSTFFCGKCQK